MVYSIQEELLPASSTTVKTINFKANGGQYDQQALAETPERVYLYVGASFAVQERGLYWQY